MLSKYFSFVCVTLLFVFNSIFAQDIGELFTADEANDKFGKVIERVAVETSTLKGWINSTNDKIMFNLKGKSFTVLGDSRELVYSTSRYSESNEKFHMYSKSKLIELVNKGGKSTTYLENRNSVFSMRNGDIVLESSTPCPPFCN